MHNTIEKQVNQKSGRVTVETAEITFTELGRCHVVGDCIVNNVDMKYGVHLGKSTIGYKLMQDISLRLVNGNEPSRAATSRATETLPAILTDVLRSNEFEKASWDAEVEQAKYRFDVTEDKIIELERQLDQLRRQRTELSLRKHAAEKQAKLFAA